MSSPKISVLMSVYNGEPFLCKAIESVLNQTFGDFEFIIFDDKSLDASASIVRNYGDDRILFIENEENVGLTKNLCTGMAMAKGEYIARMDADDVCLPQRLERQVQFLDEHPEISVLGSAVYFFDNTGKEILGLQPTEHEEIKCELLYQFTMLHPSVMMRRGDCARHGLNYNPHFVYSQDFDLWVRSVRKLRFANLREPLIKMREHEMKLSRKVSPTQRGFSDEIRKRQLDELEVAYTDEELEAFHNVGSGIFGKDVRDITNYESVLLKIFERNKDKCIFDQSLLQKVGASHFRHLCWADLVQGRKSGRYYWRSQMKNFDTTFPFAQKARMAIRSFFAH